MPKIDPVNDPVKLPVENKFCNLWDEYPEGDGYPAQLFNNKNISKGVNLFIVIIILVYQKLIYKLYYFFII